MTSISLLPFERYDRVIVAFSGGKDSLAVVLALLDQGIDPSRIELWHHRVDGARADARPWGMEWDWRVTDAYCEALAEAMGLPLFYSWRVGGIAAEMARQDATTGAVCFEAPGPLGTKRLSRLEPSARAPKGTRRKFPAVSADLATRWCSAAAKIDVGARVLNNRADLQGKCILFCTGERREESPARAKYLAAELHRCHSGKKTVHHWRPIIDWTSDHVWDIIRRHGIRPHPAYYLGFGRTSCMTCIFGQADQWATVAALDPARVVTFAAIEADIGHRLYKEESINARVARGRSLVPEKTSAEFVAATLAGVLPWTSVRLEDGEEWMEPAGATAGCVGGSV